MFDKNCVSTWSCAQIYFDLARECEWLLPDCSVGMKETETVGEDNEIEEFMLASRFCTLPDLSIPLQTVKAGFSQSDVVVDGGTVSCMNDAHSQLTI